MASLRKLRGIYYLDWYGPDGKRHRDRASDSRKTAEQILRAKQDELDRAHAGLLDFTKQNVPLQRVFEEYQRDLKLRRAAKTCYMHKRAIQFLSPFIRVETVRDLTPMSLVDALEMMKKRGLSARTMNVYVGVIRRALRWAEESGMILQNPLLRMKKFPEVRVHLKRALNEAEVAKLMAACAPTMRLIVEVLVQTGLRRAELIGLEWRDLDLNRRSLTVRAETAKTKKQRTIPLRSDLVARLKAHHDSHLNPGDFEPVFLTGEGTRFGQNFNREFVKAVEASGIREDGVCPHALRYTCATRMVRAGVDPRVVQAILGHADPRITLSIYTDVRLLDLEGAVEKPPALPAPTPTSVSAKTPDKLAG